MNDHDLILSFFFPPHLVYWLITWCFTPSKTKFNAAQGDEEMSTRNNYDSCILNPDASIWIARTKKRLKSALVVYFGRSSLLKHVCALGSCDKETSIDWIVKRQAVLWGPWRLLKPATGTQDVPVVNWRRRARSSSGRSSTTSQNHLIIWESDVYSPRYSVLQRQSSTSIWGSPHIKSSNSWKSNTAKT